MKLIMIMIKLRKPIRNAMIQEKWMVHKVLGIKKYY